MPRPRKIKKTPPNAPHWVILNELEALFPLHLPPHPDWKVIAVILLRVTHKMAGIPKDDFPRIVARLRGIYMLAPSTVQEMLPELGDTINHFHGQT
jgi:hypothetical protein